MVLSVAMLYTTMRWRSLLSGNSETCYGGGYAISEMFRRGFPPETSDEKRQLLLDCLDWDWNCALLLDQCMAGVHWSSDP
ncbi:hypothetical protein MPTK1_5g05350 [Marchantia polymorpha subsp. ruderalis]|uniref:Uncharacterized protein n=2 Tax=Marchantia polymorpha TaxID=3197 RepID=A0AAF6BF71_MARPO|nr:hypothetical protein MARPO_0027s0091 [Marchantia polymorpha]BBN10655.1 hypothetical protein Mp_5g05350 [Marchantia polymorpha subsp. ruderalis]|eukprot:PTQ42979.1 hypothetical protein MARPO_0027s0091 [Marchantia polymorpha]